MKPILKLDSQAVVLVLTIQMSALLSCAVLKVSYFRHWPFKRNLKVKIIAYTYYDNLLLLGWFLQCASRVHHRL